MVVIYARSRLTELNSCLEWVASDRLLCASDGFLQLLVSMRVFAVRPISKVIRRETNQSVYRLCTDE
jgi:hypothetical protein